MIHYHGTPITPDKALLASVDGGHALVSFAAPDQIGIVSEVCQSFVLDNGAFSAWRSGSPVVDWSPYYEWVGLWYRHPAFDWALIPDVIGGTDSQNADLVEQWPFGSHLGVPVWHLGAALDYLRHLMKHFPRIALGSSAQYSRVGSPAWWNRMAEAMDVICDSVGRPKVRLHGLRMLDPRIFTRLPLASADSTNIGRNVGIDASWRGFVYTPANKQSRAEILRRRIEAHQSADRWIPQPIQEDLWVA